MKNTSHDEANKALLLFENLETITAGAEWEKQLYDRITRSRSRHRNRNVRIQFIAFVAAFVLLNSFLFFRAGNDNSRQQDKRTEILQTVSDQLLIYSTASN